jgi:hypothetical protein
MAADESLIRAHLEEIERQLAELKEEEKILLSLKEQYEHWLAIKRHPVRSDLQAGDRRREAYGTLISAALRVLEEAYPKGLHVTEIWEQLQTRGIQSQAKRPAAALAFSLHSLEKRTGLVEKVGPNTWRWVGKQPNEVRPTEANKGGGKPNED